MPAASSGTSLAGSAGEKARVAWVDRGSDLTQAGGEERMFARGEGGDAGERGVDAIEIGALRIEVGTRDP